MAKYLITPGGDAVLAFSRAEIDAVRVLIGEGAGGILEDASATRAYIGGPANVAAARRAIKAIENASVVANAAAPASKLRARK